MEEREKTIFYKNWGGPERLEYGFIPVRKNLKKKSGNLKTGQILIRVRAISVNPVDWKIMSGKQRLLTGKRFPRIFGADFAGDVVAFGKGVSTGKFAVGDRIFGMVSPISSGSGRQYLRVSASHCLKIPEGFSYEEAASLPAAAISAIQAVSFSRKRAPGRVLVTGAGGGVGSLAIQLLAARGWDVRAVARDDQQNLLERLGCTGFLNRQSWRENLSRDWDAIVDGPGVFIRENPFQYLNRGGFYSPVYVPDGFIPWQIIRTFLRFFTSRSTGLFLAFPSKKRMTVLADLLHRGGIKPVIDSVFTADQCRQAVNKSIEGGVNGKIVIIMD